MQWDASNNGGFTSSAVVPWMKSHPNHSTLNAEAEMRDSKSAFNCWRSALEARRHYKDIVVYGDFHLVDAEHEKIFAYIRRSEDGQQVLVVCNFSPDTLLWTGNSKKVQQVVLSNCNKILEDFNGTGVSVAPYEAFAVLVAGS
jgi:glycosidase